MSKALLTVALVLASSSAMASSIEVIHGNRTGNGSVVSVTCEGCPKLAVKIKPLAETAPALAPGTQDISVRDVDGKKQMVRREAWLGGSPVTYVSNNPAWLTPDNSDTLLSGQPATIDRLVKTSAVETVINNEAAIPVAADTTTPLSLDGLSLRQSQQ